MALVIKQPDSERTVGYLGPQGTYSEETALCLYRGEQVRFIRYVSIDAAIRAVEDNEASECIVPIENSLEGSVNVTLDTMAHDTSLFITREITRPIRHSLLIKTGTQHINVILSHSQALAQCRRTLLKHYPGAELRPVGSTAEASYIVAGGAKNHAAVASTSAAVVYGLETAMADVQDYSNNCTRFIVLERQPVECRHESQKTSIVCQINGERPGSLCEILLEFAQRNVNLTRIESRPARTGLGMYIFFLDMEGGMDNNNVYAAVRAVELRSKWFKNFGSYPVHHMQS